MTQNIPMLNARMSAVEVGRGDTSWMSAGDEKYYLEWLKWYFVTKLKADIAVLI